MTEPTDATRAIRPGAAWEPAGGGPWTDIRYETAAAFPDGDGGGRIAKITIDRPEVRNAFRPQTVVELADAFDAGPGGPRRRRDHPHRRGRRWPSAPAATSGSGATPATSATTQIGQRGVGRFHVTDLHVQIRRLPKPVVAMVAGYAIGGGHVLHVVCDLTIAADNARFGQTGPRVGSFDGGFGASRAGPPGRPEEGQGDLVPLPPVRRRAGRSTWAWSTPSCPSRSSRRRRSRWCREMLRAVAVRPAAAEGQLQRRRGRPGRHPAAGPRRQPALLRRPRRRRRAATPTSRSDARTSSSSPSARDATCRPAEQLGGRGPAPHAAGRGRAGAVGTACAVGEVPGGLIWWRAACRAGRGARHPGRHQLRQRLQRRRPGHRRPRAPGRAGAARRVRAWPRPAAVKRAALAAFGVAGVAGLALAARRRARAARRRRRVASPPAGSTPAARGPTATPGFGEVFVFVFFGVVATVGSAYVQTERARRAWPLAASVPGRASWPPRCSWSTTCATSPATPRSGKRTLAVRLGDRPHPARSTSALLVGAFVARAARGRARRPAGRRARARRRRARPAAGRAGAAAAPRGPALIPVLGATGRVQLVFGVLLRRRPRRLAPDRPAQTARRLGRASGRSDGEERRPGCSRWAAWPAPATRASVALAPIAAARRAAEGGELARRRSPATHEHRHRRASAEAVPQRRPGARCRPAAG